MGIDKELIDKLPANYQKPEDIIGENGLLKQLTKALVERAMEAERTTHLGYEKHDPVGYGSGNSHNGKSRKQLKGDFGEVQIETGTAYGAGFATSSPVGQRCRATGKRASSRRLYRRAGRALPA
jgi:putative transposase